MPDSTFVQASQPSGRPAARTRDLTAHRRKLLEGVNLQSLNEHERLRRVREFVAENYTEPIDLNAAATVASMERCSFSRFFSATTGVPYSSWLARTRLCHALELFESEPRINVTDIAFAVGFSTLRTFERSFKKYLGFTAGELKRSLQPLEPQNP